MKKRSMTFAISLSLAILLVSTAASQTIEVFSNFNNNKEGWTIAGNSTVTDPNYNTGGFIDCVEATGNAIWFFVSPTSWNGYWTSYIGATLGFDFMSLQQTGGGDVNNVRIYNGSNYVAWDYPITPSFGEWTHYEVVLNASNFDRIVGTPGTTFQSIMSNVTSLWIRGDYGGVDQGALDNVMIYRPGNSSPDEGFIMLPTRNRGIVLIF